MPTPKTLPNPKIGEKNQRLPWLKMAKKLDNLAKAVSGPKLAAILTICQASAYFLRLDAEGPEHLLLAVPAVAAGVDANGRQFAALSPALDGEGRDAEDFGDLANS